MNGKKSLTRFSIQFNRADPAHRQAVEILNGKERYEKAQYIVDAILNYEKCAGMLEARNPAAVDEKHIEAIVNKILKNRENNGAGILSAAVSAGQNENILLIDAEVDFDEAVEALGDDGFNAIAGALDMFRKK